MRLRLTGAALAALVVAACPTFAATIPTPPALDRIERIAELYPDLHERELGREGPSWARLRRMADSRYVATHPYARARALATARRSPRHAMWITVNSCECDDTWDCNTGNGYQGGLQMDASFQSTYGPEFVAEWGGAHNWPVWAQMRAADRAYESRGLTPWPVCGLAALGYRPVP